MAHSNSAHDHDDLHVADDSHHIVSPMQYLAVYIALLVATGLTVGAAFIDLGPFNPILALAMLTVAAGFFTFLVLIMMTLSDYMSRSWGLW